MDDKSQSELKTSIKKRGQNSYYYAHNYENTDFNNEKAKKFYGDGIIHGGEPVLVERKSTVTEKEEPKMIAIKKYSWNDEDAKVKVYIELDQFPCNITKDMIEVAFDEYACNVVIKDAEGQIYKLTLSKLHEKIEIDKSSWRFSEGKRISITFKKWLETKWTALLKEKK